MRRADRLFRIVQLLRRRRVTTAARLAEALQVSERTVYRDLRDLSLSGVPLRGEAGVGYTLDQGFDLPPLMFNREEIEALVLGARIVKGYSDPALAQAAEEALSKIETVLPDPLKRRLRRSRLYAVNFETSRGVAERLRQLREAVRDRRIVELGYRRGDGQLSTRAVHPLALTFFAPKWMLTGWCELRESFRTFRLDRIQTLQVCAATFTPTPGRRMEDFLRQVEAEPENNG